MLYYNLARGSGAHHTVKKECGDLAVAVIVLDNPRLSCTLRAQNYTVKSSSDLSEKKNNWRWAESNRRRNGLAVNHNVTCYHYTTAPVSCLQQVLFRLY